MKEIAKLQFITSDPQKAEAACQAGIDWIQLRIKDASFEFFKEKAQQCRRICTLYKSKFIINDNVAIARSVGADGVHLGKHDMPHHEARALLGDDFIIGGTANTLRDVEELTAKGVDYIGIGPYRKTSTKKNLSPVLGLAGISGIIKQKRSDLPVVAIGGINEEDLPLLMSAGVYGVAVSSAIEYKRDAFTASKQFLNKLNAVTVKKEDTKLYTYE